MEISELPIHDSLLTAVADLGFTEATPVQEAVIPQLMQDTRDIIALAQTGTGKTAAFGLPLLEKLRTGGRATGALVLCPTRELALQVSEELRAYAAKLPDMVVETIYGGAGYGDQIRALKRGARIVVATPGRLLDLIQKGVADLSSIEYLVLDEADIMLNMGFKEELDTILSTIPDSRQTLLFSATMPPEVARIAENYMREPEMLSMGRRGAAAEGVEHYYYAVHAHEKYAALKRLVDYHPDMYGIVFCRTKMATQEIADRLVGDGYQVEALHGDLSQAQRELVMKKFRRQSLQLIVATDIAARGLDVQDLSHVIHYDLPDEIEIYTHRSGRTGRAGKSGYSYAIVTPRDLRRLPRMESTIGRSIHRGTLPGGQEIFRRQLIDYAARVGTTEVDEEKLAPYSETLAEQFADLSREELIRKLVTLEFDNMIDYYHELPDMTALNDRGRSGFRNHPAKGRESGKGPSRNRRDDRKDGVENGYTAISINLGSKDKVAPPDLIGLVNQSSRRRGVDIGRIKISASRSTLQVEDEAAEATAHALNGFTYRGRKVRAQLMDGSGGHDRAPSKGKGHSGSRPSKEQRREHRPAHASARASSGSDAKRSGQLRYGRKPLDMDD